MRTVYDVLQKVDQIAPFRYAANNDNVGILAGDRDAYITKCLVCLDITMDVVEEALRMGANLIISHHPAIFDPVNSVTKQATPVVFEMVRNGISAIAVHTNLDLVEGGVNDVLFDTLELVNKGPLGPVGLTDNLSVGRIGSLNHFMRPEEFAAYVKQKVGARGVRYVSGNRRIKTVAVCGGSGGSLMDIVRKSGVDAYVTGDIKHDIFIRAQNERFTLVDAGHYATEAAIVQVLAKQLSASFTDLAFKVADHNTEVVRYI